MTNAQMISALIEKNTGADGVFSTVLPGVFLLRASHPGEPVQTFYEPSFSYVANGRKRISFGSFQVTCEPSTALAVSVGLPACGEVILASPQRPFLGLRVELRQTTLEEMRGFLTLRPASRLKPGTGLMQPSGFLEDALLRTVQLLDKPNDAKVIWPLLEREITYHLLSQGDNPFGNQLPATLHRFNAVVRAANYFRSQFRKAVGPVDAARRTGEKTETLARDFKRVTGMSVGDYIRSLRLQEGRRLLMLGIDDITRLSQAVGYRTVTKFINDYTEAFKGTPHEDARRRRRSLTIIHEE
ncbi:AraC family transcriptional regulator N-terminal domain-containing protein [Agrobacterium tumefaciens]|uniref:AraC family transcriptional regulator N-terminal domain-containing protein n=1 Tax=Agrobacterium tumefaciens TaxID=358 RepID=UPI0021D2239C|nr:AraC family transcriptional regulator N-terminal domain-containing protein [Agrobacterium tumefaciens]UXS05380.1 helix-turn-helix domain-containing protein [Agrobacterium tumefaciens]